MRDIRRLPLAAITAVTVGLLFAGLGAAQPAALPDPQAEQLKRGEDVYFASCAVCHNDNLSGGAFRSAPPLAGAVFQTRWTGRSAAELLAVTKATMPEGMVNSLPEQAYVDVVAFMLQANQAYPEGAEFTAAGAPAIVFNGERTPQSVKESK